MHLLSWITKGFNSSVPVVSIARLESSRRAFLFQLPVFNQSALQNQLRRSKLITTSRKAKAEHCLRAVFSPDVRPSDTRARIGHSACAGIPYARRRYDSAFPA
jgi:hypothetical protein